MAKVLRLWLPGPSPASSDGSFLGAGQRPDLIALLPPFHLLSFCLVCFPGAGCLLANILLRAAKLTFSTDPRRCAWHPVYQTMLPKSLCLSSPGLVSVNQHQPSYRAPLIILVGAVSLSESVSVFCQFGMYSLCLTFLRGTEEGCTTSTYKTNSSRCWISYPKWGIFSDGRTSTLCSWS